MKRGDAAEIKKRWCKYTRTHALTHAHKHARTHTCMDLVPCCKGSWGPEGAAAAAAWEEGEEGEGHGELNRELHALELACVDRVQHGQARGKAQKYKRIRHL